MSPISDPEMPKKKEPDPSHWVIDHTIMKIEHAGGFPDEGGITVGSSIGGGVVTSTTDSTFTVEFPSGAPQGPIDLPKTETIVVIEIRAPEGVSADTLSMPAVGTSIPGGGTVIAVDGTTVTIQFPNGVPEGSIDVPITETTIVDVSAPGSEEIPVAAPWDIEDTFVSPASGGFNPGVEEVTDELHKRYRLPCPSTRTNALELNFLTLFNPRNTSSCPCATLYIGSLGPDGRVIRDQNGNVIDILLKPGESQPKFVAAPGATKIIVACNAACEGCSAELTIDFTIV